MYQDQTNNAHRIVLVFVVVLSIIFVFLLEIRPTVIETYTGVVIKKYECDYNIGDVKKYVEYYVIFDSGEDYKISKFAYDRINVGNSVKINSLSDGTNTLSKIER